MKVSILLQVQPKAVKRECGSRCPISEGRSNLAAFPNGITSKTLKGPQYLAVSLEAWIGQIQMLGAEQGLITSLEGHCAG